MHCVWAVGTLERVKKRRNLQQQCPHTHAMYTHVLNTWTETAGSWNTHWLRNIGKSYMCSLGRRPCLLLERAKRILTHMAVSYPIPFASIPKQTARTLTACGHRQNRSICMSAIEWMSVRLSIITWVGHFFFLIWIHRSAVVTIRVPR